MQGQNHAQAQGNNINIKKRVYFSMLEHVGTKGKYQYLMMFFIFIIGMESSACFLVNPYLFYEQPFSCPKDIGNCNQFVCSLPQDARVAYVPLFDGKISLVTQLKGRCQSEQFILLLNSSIILGSVIGIFSAIFFTQWLGRRWTMILSLVTSVFGLFLCLIRSQVLAVVGVFLFGAGLDISYSCIFTLITEFFAENDRGFFYNIITLSFASGIFLNSLTFYYIDSWKVIILAFFILPMIVAILGFVFWVEDTPLELVAYKKPEQIFAAFQRIAKRNSVGNHGLTIEAVSQIKQEYDENQRKKHSRVFSIIDIFRFESLRANIIPLGALKFVMMFIFYAPGILLNQFAMNMYVNGFINGLSMLCGIPLQLWLLQFHRKYVTYILFASSALFAVAMFISKQLCTDCNGETTLVQAIELFMYRISCTIASFIVVVMLNQTYPAQIRNLAVFINISFGRSATLLVPFVPRFCDFTHIPFLVLLALCSVLGMGLTCFAKETFGIVPPEMIEQVQIEKHNYKHYQLVHQQKGDQLHQDKNI